MGTNFYARFDNKDVSLHLGKRSAGWPFLFCAQEGEFETMSELIGWLENTPNIRIFDEYQEEHDLVEWVRMARKWGSRRDGTPIASNEYLDPEGFHWLQGAFS